MVKLMLILSSFNLVGTHEYNVLPRLFRWFIQVLCLRNLAVRDIDGFFIDAGNRFELVIAELTPILKLKQGIIRKEERESSSLRVIELLQFIVMAQNEKQSNPEITLDHILPVTLDTLTMSTTTGKRRRKLIILALACMCLDAAAASSQMNTEKARTPGKKTQMQVFLDILTADMSAIRQDGLLPHEETIIVVGITALLRLDQEMGSGEAATLAPKLFEMVLDQFKVSYTGITASVKVF